MFARSTLLLTCSFIGVALVGAQVTEPNEETDVSTTYGGLIGWGVGTPVEVDVASLIKLGMVSDEVEVLPNGKTVASPSGETLNVSCNAGYSVKVSQATLNDLTGAQISCAQDCGVLPVINGDNVPAGTADGTTVKVNCSAGMKAVPESATCSDGEWCFSNAVCVVQVCGVLPVANGSDVDAGAVDGTSVNITCDAGLIATPANATCSDGAWSTPAVTCSAKPCDELVITNGKTVPESVPDGETVDVICDFGYHATAAQVTCNQGVFTAVRCEQRCVLLIGGNNNTEESLVEYYHPKQGVECDVAAIGNMSTANVAKIALSSACYMSDTEKILIREATHQGDNPPMVYGLADSSATELSLPYQLDGKRMRASDTVTAAVSGYSCISCGGGVKASDALVSKDQMSQVHSIWHRDFYYWNLRECYKFDSSLNEWSTMPLMPQGSAASASVLIGGNDFYIIGGAISPGKHKNWLFHYDVGAKTWHTEPNMTETRQWHGAAPLSATEFIVCGGYDKKKSCEIYDTTTKTWRSGGNMIEGRHSFRMFNFKGQVYALGGIGNGIATAEKYDQATDTWSDAKPLKHKRSNFRGVVV